MNNKPLNTPEELKKANEEFALECRPIRPDIHWKELRAHLGLPKCLCSDCNNIGCADTAQLIGSGNL